MTNNVDKLMVATIAGLVIATAAAFAVTPANAEGYNVDAKAQVTNIVWYDHLNVRKWPAHYSQKTGALMPNSWVWVERCIQVENSSDWCKVENGNNYGWVNSKFLNVYAQTSAIYDNPYAN